MSEGTVSRLPADYTRPSPPRLVEAVHSYELDEATKIALLKLSSGSTPFTALLAAFFVLAFRFTGDEDISIGTSSESAEPITIRSAIEGKETFKAVLERVQKLEKTGVTSPNTTSPPLRIYNMADTPSQKFLSSTGLNTDLTIFVTLTAAQGSLRSSSVLPNVSLRAAYNSLLFRNERITLACEQLAQIVRTAAENPEVQVGAISMITSSQQGVLPDPTSDLNWGEFRGPIHEIFAANAKKHPERTCVVETADPSVEGSKKRVFTYQHIHEASNVLAHHLVAKGIQRGDVVMVYAYRGVDLVVAVMGVLKAGATFSVIDPAYPPTRQNIYLSVARPRALVVLDKAGRLSPTVRKYIADELDLLTEVPALQILDGGKLVGGEVEGKDVLEEQQSLKEQDTGVVVGPDSTPTLSFTSGSEGVPKGVRGRHFSLTYYFPWMAKTFGLSEKDHFTMLSGIAHDPIQRDIFTPLFLGAQLLVPTADDIGTPGRLAEWMAENGASVTHLTPAMGQLLSAQATAEIPSLHHAFFVGDVLTKRDCLRLQSLARNVFIVNMYGTTETQRSVSYFEVASLAKDPQFLQTQKDIIPAGQGMLDVQLLVVNRNDRTQTCGVGEIGEIYVRAGGLAEGYLQLPDMTAEKFLKNWFVEEGHWKNSVSADAPWKEFWLGPRDRMYRTGDLGRYLPNGNVECSGRADNQVKIRGFRIELGEIDTHLSQHKLVRENVTLVRRDKDEEPTLVSYIVPQTTDDVDGLVSDVGEEDDEMVKGLKMYRKLIRDVREYLKTKLPSYAVPTVIVPLSRMPLNPNGKVDKPALPFPDTAQLSAAAKKTGGAANGEKLTPTQQQMRDIWLSVLPHTPAELGTHDNFFDVGGHSILATRMIFEVRRKFVIDVPLGLVFKEPTIEGLAREVDKIRGADLSVVASPDGGASQANSAGAEQQTEPEVDYAADADELVKQLSEKYETAPRISLDKTVTVLVTGATGFLGVFLLRDLLERTKGNFRIIAHVRAGSAEKGLERIQNSCEAYGVWNIEWKSKIEVVIGDLGAPKLGLSEENWETLSKEVDVVVHNGALVHWVYPYAKLRDANVVGTLSAIELCGVGKPKAIGFVSSTSVLDTDHFVHLSDAVMEKGGAGVPESDDLSGSRYGLGTGYGQSKWVGEYLVREAGRRGLAGSVIRPGYVVGDSKTGVTNTDDFIFRLVKGSAQLGLYPDINNTVNMTPVDHVARCVVACSLHPPAPLAVCHVTGQPRTRFNEYLKTLTTFGFNTQKADYIPWRVALEKYVMEGSDNALYPLLHFVLDNLPANTKAPELDDSNTRASLTEDIAWTGEDVSEGKGVGEEEMGVCLAYLVGIGFLEAPKGTGEKELPKIEIKGLDKLASVGGRGTKV
ncbi:large subunit of alpha-aminoadipate reductase [Saitoella coloradoensis]